MPINLWSAVLRRACLRPYFAQQCGRFQIRTCCNGPKSQVRVRFAPSPTGQLHLGGLRTALYNYLFTRSHGGKFILRIEDTDQTRLVPGAMEKLIDTLQWAGLDIDEGPGFGGDYGPYIQSKRIDTYWEYIQPLLENGTAYHCFCTPRRLELLRKDALRRRETPKYDNRCRHLSPDEVATKLNENASYTIRFKLETYKEPWEDMVYGSIICDVADLEGDPILLKTDRNPTYHFANIVDDHLMNISHVLRGFEWQTSTTKHILLYKAFGWTPPKFAHLPLLLNRDGTKLSKRQNDIHVEHFKESGFLPETVLNLLTVAGSGFKSNTTGMDLPTLIQNFDLSSLNTNSTRLDNDRTRGINRIHLQKKINSPGLQELVEKTKQLIDYELSSKYHKKEDLEGLKDDAFIQHILNICQTRIDILEDLFSDHLSFIWFIPDTEKMSTTLSTVTDPDKLLLTLSESIQNLEQASHTDFLDTKQLAGRLKTLAKMNKIGMKPFMTTLRVALTGSKEGPSVAEILSILGKETSLKRIKVSKSMLEKPSLSQAYQ